MKYIFVEGFDDNNLISEFVKDKEDIQIIQYAERKNEKVDGMEINMVCDDGGCRINDKK